MTYTEKGTVEDFIIKELVEKLGWKYVDPKEMNKRRKSSFEDPLVAEDLKRALRRINKVELTEADLDFVLVSLRTIPANVNGIRRLLYLIRNGIVVTLQKEKEEKVIKLIDFENPENNEFIVTNQFKVEGLRKTDRADIVLLINGIPLVLIECKSPTREEVSWIDAYKQIKRYEREIPELFKYVQFSIATDAIKTYYFPNAFNEEGKDFLSIWKDPYPFKKEEIGEDTLRTTIYGLLSKQNLLDILENFIFMRKENGTTTKIMARYMQFRAANKIFHRVLKTLRGEQNKRFGLIWHWLGAGKTYTMAFSVWKLFNCPEAERPSIFVMVDRKELEEQIEKDFSFIEVPIEHIEKIRDLIEVLKWGKGGKRGIFLVTIEKFSPKEFLELEKMGTKIEIRRKNVIVLADEVHRTHYGKFSIMMRSVFRNAFIFGFTGTPLSKAERNTFQKFCPKGELYLDRYSMINSLEDGFTVRLAYQARLPEYHLNKEQLKEITYFEEEELEKLTPQERRELKRKVRPIEIFVKKPERIKTIVRDLVERFKNVVEPTGLKAMIVTIDREACVLYKKALDELLPQDYSEVVMSPAQSGQKEVQEFFDELQERFGTKDIKTIHKKIIDSFKTKDKPKILIVTNMLITGFDAPNLWAMYLDKPLKEHRILQAIARTNRPYRNKKFGLIIDYIGVFADLEKAFEKFEASDSKELKAFIRDLSKYKQTFRNQIHETLKIFKDVRKEDTYESLESALDLLIDPEKAKRFEDNMKELMRSYEMLSGDPFLKPFLTDYTWLTKIYIAYYKRFKRRDIDELKIERLSRKTQELIQRAIKVEEIERRYPTISIDERYVEWIKKTMPKSIGAAIDLGAIVRRETETHSSSPFFIRLSKEVEDILEKMRSRKIETEHAIKKLITICEKIVKWKQEEKEIGKEKYPLYEVIMSVIPTLEKNRVVSFIDLLLSHLRERKLIFKGWQLQRDVRRRVRAEIRLLLLSKFKDYKHKIDELTEKVFDALEEI